MKILVDADACPKTVLMMCQRIAERAHIPVWTVANFNHHIVSDHHVCVGSDPQEADMKVINLTEPTPYFLSYYVINYAFLPSLRPRCLACYKISYL